MNSIYFYFGNETHLFKIIKNNYQIELSNKLVFKRMLVINKNILYNIKRFINLFNKTIEETKSTLIFYNHSNTNSLVGILYTNNFKIDQSNENQPKINQKFMLS